MEVRIRSVLRVFFLLLLFLFFLLRVKKEGKVEKRERKKGKWGIKLRNKCSKSRKMKENTYKIIPCQDIVLHGIALVER